MTEIVVNTTELRKDITYIESSLDLSVVQWEADYLVDEAAERLKFAILEANEVLLAIRALKMCPIIEKPTVR